MHPRITVHDHVFPRQWGLDDVLAGFARGGAERVGIGRARLRGRDAPDVANVAHGQGVAITYLVHGPMLELEAARYGPQGVTDVIATLNAASALGCRCVYGVTGPALSLTWEQAAGAFIAAAQPMARHAHEAGVQLLIEPTNMLFADVSFLHTLRDTVDVAREAGLGVCVDVQHCWTERGLAQTIATAGDLIGLVQLSDVIPGRRSPFRAVPGDGVIPVERIVSHLLDCGYGGPFDLELYEEPGVDSAQTIARAIEHLSGLLDRLGA
jgi:sugar phosphate isomerase/epimerase